MIALRIRHDCRGWPAVASITAAVCIGELNNSRRIFRQDVEIPAGWTQLATNVIVSKYFYGENGTEERERSVKQLIHRVTRTIADWGIEDGYFASPEDGENFYRELTWLCLNQHGAFNSPYIGTNSLQPFYEKAYTWTAIFMPKDTPAAIAAKMQKATSEAMESPGLRDELQTLSAVLVAPERRSSVYLGQFV